VGWESRGGHFRDDFPDKAPEFGKFNIVTADTADGAMAVRRVPIPPIPPELAQIIEDQQK
jgi:succinate dehydrogenase / fumarate reductase flavoprotein subunit